ncbi:MAG: hypothetical protein II721_02830 [Bacilli bacterium]|nr:hypothetical protein [Bacilli bacterium]
MMFESREEELARKLAAKEREDTDRAIVQLIKGMDVTYEKVAEVLEVPLARVLAVAEREGYTPKVEGSIKLIKEGEE